MLTREQLAERDAGDALAPVRERFFIPPATIYLDGNSLGPMPRAVPAHVRNVIENQWGEDLITSWNRHDWVNMPKRLGEKLAPLLGAAPGQVAVADSTSVNLFKVLSAALAVRGQRSVVLSEAGNFPTDLYVAQGLVASCDCTLKLAATSDEVVAALDEDTAVLMLTQVDFRSGELHDIARVSEAAHEAGALVIWDLAHSAGAVPLQLDAWQVDLAIGCGYKYLNGGPGAPAFVYVNQAFQARFQPLLQGWFAHARPFDFDPQFVAADGIRRALCGTPPVLSMAALEVGLETFDGVEMAQVREKSLALTDSFMAVLQQECGDYGMQIVSPREPARRGSQVAVKHPDAYAAMQALIARGVIGDFRSPDIMRFGFAPLYIRFVDVWDAVATLQEIFATRSYDDPLYRARAEVT
ncbi:MAG: kynureninase [Gammaproteobacteria bacterium]|nr:kynureninase [Gammaproteobacteria bacterium]